MHFEALFTGVKEGLKLSVCVLIIISYFRAIHRNYFVKALLAGIGVVFLFSFVVVTLHISPEIRSFVVKLTGYVFGLFYLFALGALVHTTGIDLFGPIKLLFDRKVFLFPLIFILTCIFFAPDMVGSTLYLKDMYFMSGDSLAVPFLALIGFCMTLVISLPVWRLIKPKDRVFFGLPQVLLFLSFVKLFAGGIRGFAEISLIPSVQAGLMKLIHDVVHQTFIIVMVPDHPLLSVTSWNFVGYLFSKTAGLWLSLVIFVIPLLIFLQKLVRAEITVPPSITVGAFRRKFIRSVRDERILRAIPIIAFIAFITMTWFSEKGEIVSKLYDPEPVPVIAENGRIILPVSSPGVDLRDGNLHKFSVDVNGESVRFIVIKKSDGTFAVCLDACEICRPDGYAQGKGHVVCLYCMTPLDIDSLGKPGGCNPVPLDVLVDDNNIVIEISEIIKKWETVKSGEKREEVKR